MGYEVRNDEHFLSRILSGNKIRTLKRHQWKILIGWLVIQDTAMNAFAFWLAYQIRFELSIPLFQLEVVPETVFYSSLVTFLVPLWIFIFAGMGLYARQNLLGGTREYSLVFNATAIGMSAVIAFGFLQPDFLLARGWLLLAWILTFLLTALARFSARRVVYALRHSGFFLTPAIIVGANDEGLSLADQLLRWKRSGLDLIGFVDNQEPQGTNIFENLYNLGTLDTLKNVIDTYGIKEIIVSSSAFTRDEVLAIFKQHGISDEVNLNMSSGLYEIITTGLQLREMAGVPLVKVNKVRLTGVDLVLKLILDYVLSTAAIVFASPLFLLLAVAIKLDSPGPIIHRRRVMGVNGKMFDAFKFRTMYVNGDEILNQNPELKAELEANHKLKVDPRITRVGALLRKTSLDELPQFFNVWRNEMSVVGPRMISPEEMQMYNQWGINLLTVKPGITGLWQVSGRSDVSYDERVRLDMQYIRNWNIWLDVQLLIETIPAVLRQRGAY
jgi:exopolysaccharide biosynthesis polyprenyl glycosylphosphotransferase